ncbi:MAG TPA: hypothetical protein VHQ97_08255, partial [Solirubrobacterales bacterium]|nr:hypothetical protein [Solirubrobacterales bacterium]
GRRQDAVTGHDLRSRNDAVDLIEEIQRTQENAARKVAAREAAKEKIEAEAERRQEEAEAPPEPTQPQKQKQGGK